MKMKKMLGLLVFLLLLVSCKANPANAINEQLKKIQITNNTLITQINSLTAHDSEELQAAFEFDLNAETMTLESSKMKELLDLRKQEISEYESHLDSFSKRISELEEIDLENLEKGNSQFNTIKTNLVSLNDLYTNVKAKISELFEAEDNLIKITIAEDPSIQELQETLALVNTKNSEFYGLLSQLKETDTQLVSNLDNWKKALESEEDPETTPNEDVNVPTEETPVVSEPEEPVVENKILYRILDDFRIESIEPVEKPLVLLTIDDSVQPEPDSYTLEIAKTLKEKGVYAIFFFNGMHLESDFGKDILKQVYDMGFTIGNHTHTHPYLDQLNYEETKEEIAKTNDIIESVTGERPKFFRPPFGIMGDHSAQVLKEEGMVWMNWTYGYDWEEQYMDKDALADIMVNTPYLSDGANLLMHDRQWTSEAMGTIVDSLIEKGYLIINPSEIDTQGDNDEL